MDRRLWKSKAVHWSLVCLALMVLIRFLLGLPAPHRDSGPVQAFPPAFIPQVLAFALIPVIISILERRWHIRSVCGRILINIAASISTTLVCFLVVGKETLFTVFESTNSADLNGQAIWLNLLFVATWVLIATLLFGIEQTGRGLHSRLILAVFTVSCYIAFGFLWQSRLQTYFWWTSFFDYGWLDWRVRILCVAAVLTVSGFVAAINRLKDEHGHLVLVVRSLAFLLAVSVFGMSYRHPAIWKEGEIEDIGFACLTSNSDLIVVASRHSDHPDSPNPGALLRRRPGERDFTCLTRASIMAPQVSNPYGSYAVVDLVSPWAALIGPGSRMRVAAFDGSCSQKTSALELWTSAGFGNDFGGPWVVIGPNCTCINSSEVFEDNGTIWLANGRSTNIPVPGCEELWFAGHQLILLVEDGDRAELIKIDLFSGATVRNQIRYPARIHPGYLIAPSGRKFIVESAETTTAWFCDLEGNCQPTVLPRSIKPSNPFDYTPTFWSHEEMLETLDQSAYQVALKSLNLEERDLKNFFPDAVKIGDRIFLVQKHYNGEARLNIIYEFDVLDKKMKLINRRAFPIEYGSDNIVMLLREKGMRRVEQYWPKTGKREILLEAPVVWGYQPRR